MTPTATATKTTIKVSSRFDEGSAFVAELRAAGFAVETPER